MFKCAECEVVIVSDVANCVQNILLTILHQVEHAEHCSTTAACFTVQYIDTIHPSSLQQQPSNSNFTHRGQASKYKGCDKWQGHANTTATTWLAAYQLSAAVCKAGNGHGFETEHELFDGVPCGVTQP